MTAVLPGELQRLLDELQMNRLAAQAIVEGLTPEQGIAAPEPGAWSVAECLEHLAIADGVYLRAMTEPVAEARRSGWLRTRPAKPGLFGAAFVWQMEPPASQLFRLRAPRIIRPALPPLAEAHAHFLEAQEAVRAFIPAHADLDLARIRFPNPFIKGIRWSMATGLHVITAHERRHLWQARNARVAVIGSAARR